MCFLELLGDIGGFWVFRLVLMAQGAHRPLKAYRPIAVQYQTCSYDRTAFIYIMSLCNTIALDFILHPDFALRYRLCTRLSAVRATATPSL